MAAGLQPNRDFRPCLANLPQSLPFPGGRGSFAAARPGVGVRLLAQELEGGLRQ